MTTKNIGILIVILLIGLGAYSVGKQSSINGDTTEPVGIGADASMTATNNNQYRTGTQTADNKTQGTPTKPTTGVVLTSGNTAGFHSTNDSTYHFTVHYPPTANVQNTFTTFHEIGNNWRLYAGAANQGKRLLEISLHSIDQGAYSTGKQTYPLYFTSIVRVGVSPNVKDCYTHDAGYSNQKISDVTINGVTWKKFSTTDSATMKYTQSESYRTIHGNMCFAIEQIKNGTTYRDEKMTMGTTEEQLATYYNEGNSVIRTFTFTR